MSTQSIVINNLENKQDYFERRLLDLGNNLIQYLLIIPMVGYPQYVSGNAGKFMESVPTSNYIRVIGHIAQNRILHFNPDNIWLKKTNFDL